MKVPPLIINLKSIEKHDKHDKHDKHEKHDKHDKHEKHDKHKKQKKHKKHKHKHHHHDHEHHSRHHQEHPQPGLQQHKNPPPLLEAVDLPEPHHHPHNLFPFQSAYPQTSPTPNTHTQQHAVPTPPSQLDQQQPQTQQEELGAHPTGQQQQSLPEQPPLLEQQPQLEQQDVQTDQQQIQTEQPPNLEQQQSQVDQEQQSIELDLDHQDGIEKLQPQQLELQPQQQQQQDHELQQQTELQQQQQQIVEKSDQQPSKPEPNSNMSFLRLAEDGSVRMNIIGPTKQSDEGNERILNLEQVCGQLQDGLDVIPSDINDQDQVNPVEYVEPSAFGSHLPIRDSTFANITKDDSDILLEIYGGNRTCYEYAESLQNFAGGTNYLMKMADSLLDLLTEGKHNKDAVPIRQKLEEAYKVAVQLDSKQEDVAMIVDEPTDNQENSETIFEEPNEVQQQLNEIDSLLSDLRKVQERRLSSSPAPVEPDEAESKLADNILEKLTKLIQEKAKPSEICDSSSILKALGIQLDVNVHDE